MSGKKIDFFSKRKVFFGISIGLILIGIVFNCIFGINLDIQFSGGAMNVRSSSGRNIFMIPALTYTFPFLSFGLMTVTVKDVLTSLPR